MGSRDALDPPGIGSRASRRRMGAESRAIDRETDGVEVEAFAEAMIARPPRRYSPSRAGSTSSRSRATEASGR